MNVIFIGSIYVGNLPIRYISTMLFIRFVNNSGILYLKIDGCIISFDEVLHIRKSKNIDIVVPRHISVIFDKLGVFE